MYNYFLISSKLSEIRTVERGSSAMVYYRPTVRIQWLKLSLQGKRFIAIALHLSKITV